MVEVVKAASANGMDRNADANMQLAKISFLITHLAPRTHADFKNIYSPTAEVAD
ncbi:MAG: hypothetical protein WBN64_07640 [Candidatus Deferrimicrobium sp.]